MIFTAFESVNKSSVSLVFLPILYFMDRALICTRDKAIVNVTVADRFINPQVHEKGPRGHNFWRPVLLEKCQKAHIS